MYVTPSNSYSIECSRTDAAYQLSKQLKNLLLPKLEPGRELVIVCIGTDRSTGDCLGPLVGEKLSRFHLNKNISIHGTLKNPIHAKNLNTFQVEMVEKGQTPLILAIDASLGRSENVGKINLYSGPVYPGSGVNKRLAPVGDVSITGIVNVSGFMEYLVLQSTRLSLVMNMAEIISTSIFFCVSKLLPYESTQLDELSYV